MRKFLLASALAIPLAAAPLAAATALLTVSGTDNGSPITFSCAPGNPSASGGIVCTAPGDANFSTLSLVGSGFPNIPAPDLSSLSLDATSAVGGTHVLDITLDQTGLPGTAPAALTSTFTVNNLVGGPFGPTTESTSVNGAALSTTTFDATTTTGSRQFTVANSAAVLSDSHVYSITFTAADQTATDTIQLIQGAAIPEPASLALLGVGLVGLTLVRRRA